MKQFFQTIFGKDDKAKNNEPQFTVTEVASRKSDFEVTELSFEDYARIVSKQRKKIEGAKS